jgi:dnd system-associated protein 4
VTPEQTIADAARYALEHIGHPASVPEIYETILKLNLYAFNTPHPEHVLRTTIRRHAANVERVDSSHLILFIMTDQEVYGLADERKPRMEKKSSPGVRRIHRATDKEEIISALTASNLGVFREIWKLLIFAAQVGIKNGKREPLSKIDSGRGIDQSTFGNCPAWPGILYLMSLVVADDAAVLAGTPDVEDQRLSTFQEYANGGLTVLNEFFSNRVVDLDGMLAFIDAQTSEGELKPDLDFTI